MQNDGLTPVERMLMAIPGCRLLRRCAFDTCMTVHGTISIVIEGRTVAGQSLPGTCRYNYCVFYEVEGTEGVGAFIGYVEGGTTASVDCAGWMAHRAKGDV